MKAVIQLIVFAHRSIYHRFNYYFSNKVTFTQGEPHHVCSLFCSSDLDDDAMILYKLKLLAYTACITESKLSRSPILKVSLCCIHTYKNGRQQS